MKQSSRISIEHKRKNNITKFGELEIGDIFRTMGDNRLYMMVQMPPGAIVLKQGICLDDGDRRTFNEYMSVVQVKAIVTWVDM